MSSSSSAGPVGTNYLLTYLDQDLLIGRAQGTFIFSREAEEEDRGESGQQQAVQEQEWTQAQSLGEAVAVEEEDVLLL